MAQIPDLQIVTLVAELGNLLNNAPNENDFDNVQSMAQLAFSTDDGNPHPDPQMFNYIEFFVELNQDLANAEDNIQQQLDQGEALIHQHQINPQLRQLFTRLQNQWNRVLARRDRIRQFLLAGTYADEAQLNMGYNGTVPMRFQWQNWETAHDLVHHHLGSVVQMLTHSPSQHNFVQHRVAALQALHNFDPNGDLDQQFAYIGQFNHHNQMLSNVEEIIIDSLNLVRQIGDAMPVVVNDDQAETMLILRNDFLRVYDERNATLGFLIEEGYASEEHLLNGFDGNLPPRFVEEQQQQ